MEINQAAAGTRLADRLEEIRIDDRNRYMSGISYVVPPSWTAGSDKTGASKNQNPNDPNMITTGAYGNAFELLLGTTPNSDGTATETLTYKGYTGKTNGTFSAVTETGTGSDLAGAYQALLASMKANGEMTDATASQLNDAISQLDTKSEGGNTDAAVSGGTMLVRAGGPIYFNGISAYQNSFVDSLVNELTSRLQHDSTA
jgi:hypothetical protein